MINWKMKIWTVLHLDERNAFSSFIRILFKHDLFKLYLKATYSDHLYEWSLIHARSTMAALHEAQNNYNWRGTITINGHKIVQLTTDVYFTRVNNGKNSSELHTHTYE